MWCGGWQALFDYSGGLLERSGDGCLGLPGIFLLPREVWMTYGGGSGPFLEQSAGASQGAVQRIFIFEGMVMGVLS
ncbi:MAG: hypothetical protein GQ533_10170 [Methanosarcinaceae archaeon]|nr:hypothetical protein [Methanosarcinaceae archaeon]